MQGRKREQEVILEEKLVLELRLGLAVHQRVVVGQREVVAPVAQVGQRLLRVGLDHLERDLRIAPGERRNRLRDERRGGAREGGQPHRGGGRRGQVAELPLSLVEPVKDGVCVTQHLLAGGGDGQPARLADQELHAELLLEPRHVVRDRRLAVVERVCGRRERAPSGDFAKHPQARHIEHPPKLSAPSMTSLAKWGTSREPSCVHEGLA